MVYNFTMKLKDIFEIVERELALKEEELCGRSREKYLIPGRILFSAIARIKGHSYSSIGRSLGGRDHTTILHLCRLAENDDKIKQILAGLPKNDISGINSNIANKIFGKYAFVYQMYHGKCAVCQFSEVVEVCHIVPRFMGGTDVPSNLILLCPNHHSLMDKGMLAIKDIHMKHILSTDSTRPTTTIS